MEGEFIKIVSGVINMIDNFFNKIV